MSDEFTHHVIKLIIANAAMQRGITSVSGLALDTLIDAVIDRLSAYAHHAALTTTLCGRTDTNIYDVLSSLGKYGESIETLSGYLSGANTIPQFEYLVEPYPIPLPSKFYSKGTANQNSSAYPFRANMTYPLHHPQANKHIPDFFSTIPNPCTYDRTVAPDPPQDDTEAKKRRDADQSALQVALQRILAERGEDGEGEMVLNCELTHLASAELISKPTELLQAPLYSLAGERPAEDPEFLPIRDLTDADIIGGSNRDTSSMLSILGIVQGLHEPGAPKDTKYVPSGAGGGAQSNTEQRTAEGETQQ